MDIMFNTLFKVINTNGMKYLVEKIYFNCFNKKMFRKRRLSVQL